MAHSWGSINLEDINSEKSYDKNKAYIQSKLANVLFTRSLAQRLEGLPRLGPSLGRKSLLVSVIHTLSCRHWCDDVFPPPWSRPDRFMASSERPPTSGHEDGQPVHQELNPGSSDDHLLRCGTLTGQRERQILQVSIPAGSFSFSEEINWT